VKRGRGLIGDFGLARHTSEEKLEYDNFLPKIHELYCPQEVLHGSPYTFTSDIFQFGILMCNPPKDSSHNLLFVVQ